VFSIGNKRYVKIFFAYDPKVMSAHSTMLLLLEQYELLYSR
jgi:hypothetical protein